MKASGYKKVHIRGWCYEFPFQISVPGEAFFLSAYSMDRHALEGLLWGFNPP